MGGLQLTTRYLCKLGMGMNRYSSFVYTSSFDPPLMGFSVEVFYMFISKKMLFIYFIFFLIGNHKGIYW